MYLFQAIWLALVATLNSGLPLHLMQIAVLGVLTKEAAMTTIKPGSNLTLSDEVEGVRKCVEQVCMRALCACVNPQAADVC